MPMLVFSSFTYHLHPLLNIYSQTRRQTDRCGRYTMVDDHIFSTFPQKGQMMPVWQKNAAATVFSINTRRDKEKKWSVYS